MYKAYFSNSLEKFLDKYKSLFLPSSLFDKNSVFIVQNRNMEEWLKLKLADKTGVFAGINFQFQDETVRNIISLSPEVSKELETKKTIYLDDLKLIIFHTLDSIFRSIETYPEFSMLKNYVNHEYPVSEGEMNNIKSSRLYRLSDSIAGLFHHYGLNSPEMVKTWEKRKSYAEGTEYSYLSGNEKWQMKLWDIIFGKESSYLHPGQIIAGILDGKYSLPEINRKIIIFGSSFLSEQAVEFFHHLSVICGAEIHHFILSPSPYILKPDEEKSILLSQWGNIVSGLAEILVEKGIETEEDYIVPNGYIVPGGYRQTEGDCPGSSGEVYADGRNTGPAEGRLSSADKGYGEDSIPSRGKAEANDKLSDGEYIQSEMLSALKTAVFANKRKCAGPFPPDDSSLRIVSVPGKKREIEVLKNNIINLMQSEGYKYHDIGVAAPDINSYVPYIETIFRSDDNSLDIPYNLMDVSFIDNSDYLNGFFALLDLTGSRFTRKQLFSLFRNRCFMNRFHLSDSDVDKWLEICEKLFIKWGYDSSHRQDVLSRKSDFATWRKALERICCGFIFSDDEAVTFSSGSEIVPYHLSGSYEEKTVSELFHAVNQLYNNLYKLRFKEFEIPSWAVHMEMLADFFLSPVYGTRDDNDRKFLKNVFRQINTLVIENRQADSISGKPVPYSLYRTIVDEFAGKSGYCRGQYLSEGISFSSLKPLRAIPFKVIFLLGMDENSFPGREKNRNYDLRALVPKSIDLSVQNTDCFTFLETILSAEEKLFISYTGTNIITGEILEPSPLVTEIAEMFEPSQAACLQVFHPLHAYDEVYFRARTGFRDFISFEKLQYEAASAVRRGVKKKPSAVSLDTGFSLPDNPEAETDVYRMEKYLKYPVSFFLEYVEGISLNETALAENDETEEFSISDSDGYSINSEIAGSTEADKDIFSRYIDSGKTAGLLNNSSVSNYEYSLVGSSYDNFSEKLKAGGFFNSSPCDVVLSEKSVKGDNLKEMFCSPVVINAGSGTVTVSGRINGMRNNGNLWYCISYGKSKIRSLISPFFRFLLLKKALNNNDISLTVFDGSGIPSAVFEGADYDADTILGAAAFSYIESFNRPVTVDIGCIEELVKKRGGIENADDFFSFIDEYYSSNNFADSRYLNSGADIVMNYRRDDFYRLYKEFYCRLDTSRKGS